MADEVMTQEGFALLMEKYRRLHVYEELENAAGMAAAFGGVEDVEKLYVLQKALMDGVDVHEVSKAYDKMCAENKVNELKALEDAGDSLIESFGYNPKTLEPLDSSESNDYCEVEPHRPSLKEDIELATDELAESLASQIRDLFFSK